MSAVATEPGKTLCVEDLCFALRRSSRRKTMQITVERSGDLILSAPPQVDESRLRQFVLEKRFWIYTKLAEEEVAAGRSRQGVCWR